MSKKIVKLSIIRKDEGGDDPCPFGLSILVGCKNVGDLIDKMAPLNIMGQDSSEEEKQAIKIANNHLLRWQSPGTKCKYADKIIDIKNVVDCDFDTNTAGEGSGGGLEGSEGNYRQFAGMGYPAGGAVAYPFGHYNNNEIDPGIYSGPFSIESISSFNEPFSKEAAKSDYVFFHQTYKKHLDAIKEQGLLKNPRLGPKWYTLTDSLSGAKNYGGVDPDAVILEIHIPKKLVDEYVYMKCGGQSEYYGYQVAIKKDIPPSFIKRIIE
jgi:hypothetical protein